MLAHTQSLFLIVCHVEELIGIEVTILIIVLLFIIIIRFVWRFRVSLTEIIIETPIIKLVVKLDASLLLFTTNGR